MEFTFDSEHPVLMPCDDIELEGILHIPKDTKSIVLFAHGSGSSRFSSRNKHVAGILQQHKQATLLFDLLTEDEEAKDLQDSSLRFDIPFLAERLVAATNWILKNPSLKDLSIGYFGSSTGGGAALVAAARKADHVKAVVSRGGRPDMAEESLGHVRAPTLLIVGGLDGQVITLNESAFQQLKCEKELKIVPDATHLFEEPGKLDEVANLTAEWFDKYL